MEKLKKECNRAEFGHWVKCLELHLENVPGWRYATKVLQKVRLLEEEVDEENLLQVGIGINTEICKYVINSITFPYHDKKIELVFIDEN